MNKNRSYADFKNVINEKNSNSFRENSSITTRKPVSFHIEQFNLHRFEKIQAEMCTASSESDPYGQNESRKLTARVSVPMPEIDSENTLLKALEVQLQTAPSGEQSLSCTSHKAFKSDDCPNRSSLDSVKKRLITSMPQNQWPRIKSSIDTNSKITILSQLGNTIVSEMKVMSLNNNLAIYLGGYWQFVNLHSFIFAIRDRFWEHHEVLDSLSESNYRELMMKVKTTPSIIKSIDEITPNPDYINFRDGVFNLGTGKFIEQSPDHYFFNYVDVSIRDIGKGSSEYFEYYMKIASQGDTAFYTLILELVGIAISSKMIKGFFLLLGPSDSGKTQIALLIKSLLGSDNVAVIPNLNSFKKPHTTAVLKGKKACLCMDLARTHIDEESLAIIKQITGKDPVSIEKKFCDMEMLENTAKLILGANLMPPVNDPIRNDAYFRRMKIIPFRNSVPPEKQIPDIAEKMAEEKGYIVGKALEALQALRQRNYTFTEIDVDIDEYGAIEASEKRPVEAFFEECCITAPGEITFTEKFYKVFVSFCKKNKLPVQTKIAFSQEFSKHVTHLEKTHTSRQGKTLNGYRGLKIKEEFENE